MRTKPEIQTNPLRGKRVSKGTSSNMLPLTIHHISQGQYRISSSSLAKLVSLATRSDPPRYPAASSSFVEEQLPPFLRHSPSHQLSLARKLYRSYETTGGGSVSSSVAPDMLKELMGSDILSYCGGTVRWWVDQMSQPYQMPRQTLPKGMETSDGLLSELNFLTLVSVVVEGVRVKADKRRVHRQRGSGRGRPKPRSGGDLVFRVMSEGRAERSASSSPRRRTSATRGRPSRERLLSTATLLKTLQHQPRDDDDASLGSFDSESPCDEYDDGYDDERVGESSPAYYCSSDENSLRSSASSAVSAASSESVGELFDDHLKVSKSSTLAALQRELASKDRDKVLKAKDFKERCVKPVGMEVRAKGEAWVIPADPSEGPHDCDGQGSNADEIKAVQEAREGAEDFIDAVLSEGGFKHPEGVTSETQDNERDSGEARRGTKAGKLKNASLGGRGSRWRGDRSAADKSYNTKMTALKRTLEAGDAGAHSGRCTGFVHERIFVKSLQNILYYTISQENLDRLKGKGGTCYR